MDEFEHIYVFWLPGVIEFDRSRIESTEWAEWGSRGVWQIRSVNRNSRHEAEFPEEPTARIIKLYSPPQGVVLDPFVRSGTTVVVAKKLGRRWLGIDKDPNSVHTATKRINDNRSMRASLMLQS